MVRAVEKYVLLFGLLVDDSLGEKMTQTVSGVGSFLPYLDFELAASILDAKPAYVMFEAASPFEAALWCLNNHPTIFCDAESLSEFLKTPKGVSYLEWVKANP